MNLPLEVAIERYNLLREEVQARSQTQWMEAVELCRAVPTEIDVAVVWKHGRDKPCWSNIKVEIGRRIASDLTRSQDFESHELIASDAWDIKMHERSWRWKSNSNFEVRGASARRFLEGLQRGGLASFLWRLYAIRQLALSLCREDGTLGMVNALAAAGYRLPASDVHPWAKKFSKLAGMGWGATTADHMLTDLGLSVKPDIHLRRSAVRMGLFAPDVPSDLTDEEIEQIATVLDPRIVRAIVDLSAHVPPTAYSTARSALREMDKVLMEWSRQNLLRPLPDSVTFGHAPFQ